MLRVLGRRLVSSSSSLARPIVVSRLVDVAADGDHFRFINRGTTTTTRTLFSSSSFIRGNSSESLVPKGFADVRGGIRQISYGMDMVSSVFADREQHTRNVDVINIKLRRKTAFVTVTDQKGNTRKGKGMRASAGSLGSRISKFAAVSTAEHVGRECRKEGVKSVIIKVKGNMFFKQKKKAILGWKEGYNFGNRSNSSQPRVLAVYDCTNLPHNGCRKRKQPRKKR